MPIKKTTLDEIKKGVILQTEGMNASEIAKELTKKAFIKLYEEKIISTEMTLKVLIQLNEKRNIRYKKSDLINDMKTRSPLNRTQIPYIRKAFVTVDRVHRMMKSETWIEYKKAFQKKHIKLIAEKEAEEYVNERK